MIGRTESGQGRRIRRKRALLRTTRERRSSLRQNRGMSCVACAEPSDPRPRFPCRPNSSFLPSHPSRSHRIKPEVIFATLRGTMKADYEDCRADSTAPSNDIVSVAFHGLTAKEKGHTVD